MHSIQPVILYTAAINDAAPNATAPGAGHTFRLNGNFKFWIEHDNDLAAITVDATIWVRDETPAADLSDPTRAWRRLGAVFTGATAVARNVLTEVTWTPNVYDSRKESHEVFIQLTNPAGGAPTTTDTMRLHVAPLV